MEGSLPIQRDTRLPETVVGFFQEASERGVSGILFLVEAPYWPRQCWRHMSFSSCFITQRSDNSDVTKLRKMRQMLVINMRTAIDLPSIIVTRFGENYVTNTHACTHAHRHTAISQMAEADLLEVRCSEEFNQPASLTGVRKRDRYLIIDKHIFHNEVWLLLLLSSVLGSFLSCFVL